MINAIPSDEQSIKASFPIFDKDEDFSFESIKNHLD
jgi:hypothetical protein